VTTWRSDVQRVVKGARHELTSDFDVMSERAQVFLSVARTFGPDRSTRTDPNCRQAYAFAPHRYERAASVVRTSR
jgi:hypothetical protein